MSDQERGLQCELEQLQAQVAALEEQLQDKPEYGLGEGDPSIAHWELDLALLRRLKRQVARLRQVLAQGSGSDYGVCVQCGRMIHPDRLAVLPGTTTCIRCARVGAPPEAVP